MRSVHLLVVFLFASSLCFSEVYSGKIELNTKIPPNDSGLIRHINHLENLASKASGEELEKLNKGVENMKTLKNSGYVNRILLDVIADVDKDNAISSYRISYYEPVLETFSDTIESDEIPYDYRSRNEIIFDGENRYAINNMINEATRIIYTNPSYSETELWVLNWNGLVEHTKNISEPSAKKIDFEHGYIEHSTNKSVMTLKDGSKVEFIKNEDGLPLRIDTVFSDKRENTFIINLEKAPSIDLSDALDPKIKEKNTLLINE